MSMFEHSSSASLGILKPSFKERLQSKLALALMPFLGYIFMSDRINTLIWKGLGVRVGKGSIIRRGTHVNSPSDLKIGRGSLIHGNIRSRGRVTIGDYVELVGDVNVSTQKHKLDSDLFENVYEPVVIENEAWLSIGSTILSGVVIGEGAVIAASAVLTRNAEPWCVYVGIPAAKRGVRVRIDREKVNRLRAQI